MGEASDSESGLVVLLVKGGGWELGTQEEMLSRSGEGEGSQQH